MNKICNVEGCNNELYTKTYCRSHNRYNRLYGNPLVNKKHLIGRKFHNFTIFHESNTVLAKTIKSESFWIDSCDLHIILSTTFHTDNRNYLYGGNRSMGTKQIHRLIMDANNGDEIDHIDGNPLNNRRYNLRFCTRSQNMYNNPIRTNNKTGVTGVCWCKRKNKWRVTITHNKIYKHIGYYDSFDEAKKERFKAEDIYHKSFAGSVCRERKNKTRNI